MSRSAIRRLTPFLAIAPLLLLLPTVIMHSALPDAPPAPRAAAANALLNVHYLEIVTPDVDATCAALEKIHGATFSDARAELGNARTAELKGGWRIGVRAPMRDTEQPVVRPYMLVADIDAAVEAAEAAGGQIAMPPTEMPGHGRFAIYVQGGIQHGLWER